MHFRSGRRALLLISDGSDHDSDTTATDLIARARQSNVLVYPVAVGGTRPVVFAELANVTGGRTFFIEDPKRLESQLGTLARELRFQYLLGYAPSPDAGVNPGWRAIDVTVSRPDARVRARITPTKIHTCRDESNRVSGDVYVEHRDLADNFE